MSLGMLGVSLIWAVYDKLMINNNISKVCLPNGLFAFERPKNSALMIYHQIVDYFTPEIDKILMQKKITVFDVGANIGLFSMEIMHRTEGQAHVYCFEPIPETYNLLQLNLQQFDPSTIHLFNCGLGQREQYITFMYRPLAPGMSSCYEMFDTDAKKMVLSMFYNERLASKFHTAIPRFFKYLPHSINMQLISLAFYLYCKTIGKAVPVECQLSTISRVIGEQNVKKIDLLKIDVEKAEMDVLMGIAGPDWEKINAIVLEVHNIDNRQEKIIKMLTQYGFDNIQVDKVVDDQHIFNIFGFRKHTFQ
jgi:FkbM family methyltransferase